QGLSAPVRNSHRHWSRVYASAGWLQFGCPAHIRMQGSGDIDRAILLLIIFEYRHQGSSYREAGAVQGVDEYCLLPAFGAIACVHAPCLIVAAPRNAGNFSIGGLAGQPDL